MNKILIIDDDRELCALIKRSVQAEHIEADFCNTGKEGLQKLKEQETVEVLEVHSTKGERKKFMEVIKFCQHQRGGVAAGESKAMAPFTSADRFSSCTLAPLR